MKSTVDVTNQNATGNSNAITYSQTMNYVELKGALTPEEYVVLPYDDQAANQDLGDMLRRTVPGFRGLSTRLIAPPVIAGGSGPPPVVDGNGDSKVLSTGAIIGIAVGGTAALVLAGLGAKAYFGRERDGDGYMEHGKQPISQFNLSGDEDISTIEDPTVAKVGSGDASAYGNYGDQRYVTKCSGELD